MGVLYRNRPPLELFSRGLAITGIHGIVCTGTGHHGRASRGNRPPRELATTGIHRNFQLEVLPRKRPLWNFTGREGLQVGPPWRVNLLC